MNLDFLAFHNYYDRTIEKFLNRNSYEKYRLAAMTDVDFNPNDGMSTEVILEDFTNTLRTEPDYVIVWKDVDNTPIVDSRWFIMETQRLRGGQWKATLRRDVVADYLDTLLNTPIFVEKGMLKYDDSFIFNNEGMTFNQIKKEEYLIKDQSKCPWLLAYVAKKNSEGETITTADGTSIAAGADIDIAGKFNTVGEPDIVVDNIEHWAQDNDFEIGSGTKSFLNTEVDNLRTGFYDKSIISQQIFKEYLIFDNYTSKQLTLADQPYYQSKGQITDVVNYFCSRIFKEPVNNIEKQSQFTEPIISPEMISQRQPFKDKVIFDTSTSKYWRVIVNAGDTEETITKPLKGTAKTRMLQALEYWVGHTLPSDSIGLSKTGQGSQDTSCYIYGTLKQYKFYVKDITNEFKNGTITYIYNNKKHINTNAPYNIIAVPYANGHFVYNGNTVGYLDKKVALAYMYTLANEPENLVYDVQFVPYCPIPQVEGDDTDPNDIAITIPSNLGAFEAGGLENAYYSPIYIDAEGPGIPATNIGAIAFNVQEPSFRAIIDAPNEITEMINENAVERKVDILTKFTRLCSPNYNGLFEFNKQKNNGFNYFELNATYRPFQPYIHLNPHFAGLYGRDFDDSRGLICGGSFSLSRTKSTWRQYELQNKNYQQIFDRQIQNLETQYDIQNIQKIANVISGSLTGVGTGVAAGSMIGSAVPGIGTLAGGIVGGILGGGASSIAGVADYSLQQKAQAETINYTKDIFAMNLDNIKALPDSLTKVSAFDIDNKIFPFVEEYGCTPEEEEALRNKILYSGMTVGRIDYLSNFRKNGTLQFFQGQVILVEGNAELGASEHMDGNMATEIYKEIKRGVRI